MAAERVPYDEFSLFHENAEEFGLPYDGPPTVRPGGGRGRPRPAARARWCGATAEPELVLLHGGAQNAHTWDTVALALDRPLVAIDLPGHGHSDGGRERARLDPASNAADVAAAIRGPGAGRPGGGRHVARRHDRARPRRRRPPSSCGRSCSSTSRPGVDAREGRRHHRLRQRARELRQLRRAAGPHHRVQPDPVRVVAAAGHPPQRRAARGRPWVWRYARHRGRATRAADGEPSRLRRAVGRACRAIDRAADAGAGHAPAVGGRRRRRGRAAAPPARRPGRARRGGRPQRAGRHAGRAGRAASPTSWTRPQGTTR